MRTAILTGVEEEEQEEEEEEVVVAAVLVLSNQSPTKVGRQTEVDDLGIGTTGKHTDWNEFLVETW